MNLRIQTLMIFCSFSFFCHAQTETLSTSHDGLDRTYRLHLPTDYQVGESIPLVFNFHGYGSNAYEQELYSAFSPVADLNHFIVVYPEGVDNQWNSGFGGSTDDVGFTDHLITTIAAEHNINMDRIYSTGMSNGGFMSYKLACELTDKIAKIASVTGSMTPPEAAACNPTGVVPVMQIHGTVDPTVPYNGGTISIPIEDLVDLWVEKNGCVGEAIEEAIPNTNVTDNCTAIRFHYNDCQDDSEVIFYKIDGGGHTWPGAPILIGITNRDFSASDHIWSFFDGNTDVINSLQDHVLAKGDVSIAPNPFFDYFNLVVKNGTLKHINIYNAIGKSVKSFSQFNQNGLIVDTNDLEKGVYLIEVLTSNGQQTFKVIKGK